MLPHRMILIAAGNGLPPLSHWTKVRVRSDSAVSRSGNSVRVSSRSWSLGEGKGQEVGLY